MSIVAWGSVEAPVVAILRTAITLAKRNQSFAVDPDHVLAACLLSLSRFGITRLAGVVIDLEGLGIDWTQDLDSGEAQPKVAYSDATVVLLDRAATLSRADHAPRVGVVHLLAAFASREPRGLMAMVAARGIDSAVWRAAIAEYDTDRGSSAPSPAAGAPGAYLSPEQAAEFLGVHHQTIRGYIRAGKLPALRIAGERAVRIRRADLDRLLEPMPLPESE